ncbi:MAG: H-NS histone family protein, partial [Bdellovibrionales bacterium]|nr:H-NS histone family protein [Bdellovibrionales bacterium]
MSKSLDGKDEYQKLLAQRDELNDKLEILKKDRLAVLLKDFASQVKSLDVPNETVLDELRKIFDLKVSNRNRKVAVKLRLQGWEKGQIYVNPKNANESWEGGKKGPKPAWLEEQFR